MKTVHFTLKFPLFVLALIGLILAGCDSSDSDDDTPEVIPSEVFTLPVDLFAPGANKSAQPGIHFTQAAFRVWPVSAIVAANLIIPSAATAQALDAEPTFEAGTWTWQAETDLNGQPLSFALSAERIDDETVWSMRVTFSDTQNSLELTDFELFTATSSNDGLNGSWQLFYPTTEGSQNVVNADYVISGDDERMVTFSIPSGALSNAGDAVIYSEDEDARTFEWQQISAGNVHVVTWNSVTNEGSITATNYNEGAQGCWDSSLEDTPCTDS